ncbi:MAG: hypothetical protein BGO90_15200 [Legionella sp. 40-6]|nr:hypothetical protein [Legionella sp.]OJY54834.1 MAG: hypothetical protein BGO90_15200 [Legionella sp. 40-6]
MALLTAKKINSKEKIKVEIDHDIFTKISKYCEWSGIATINDFFEEAATYIFSKDKEWNKHLKIKIKESI